MLKVGQDLRLKLLEQENSRLERAVADLINIKIWMSLAFLSLGGYFSDFFAGQDLKYEVRCIFAKWK